ncbi:MAG: ATP-binding protein, partial [Verrucomicrobiota bacterium]|nr:ATP-binding protein [Verrucomicrobiota bacterium]
QIVQTRLEATHHRIHADAARMQQVFWNILGNAAKFTPEGGSVAVQTHNLAPDRLLIEFTDRGIGIDPKFIGKIFGAFEQIDVHREGLGLGLAISKAIVERHGGAIYARSAGVGHGSTFTVELPIA